MSEKQKLADNLATFFPFMYKKVIRSIPATKIPRQQIGLLFQICNEDGKPMSHYSEKMMVPKPNLTVMSDKLIKMGLIERDFDEHDRRIIILKITQKGREFLEEHKKNVRRELAKNLEVFSDEDIKRLNGLIEEMKAIFSKIE